MTKNNKEILKALKKQRKVITSSKVKSREFLFQLGTHTKTGRLSKNYR